MPPPDPLARTLDDDFAADEQPLSLAAAAKLPCVSINGRPRHPAALYRWAAKGLETRRISGITVTSRSAVLRYIAGRGTSPGPVSAPTPAAARRAHEAAEAELVAAGI